MKKLIALGVALSFSAMAANTNYAPNDGTARPGNPGTGLNKSSNDVTHMDPTVLESDPTVEGNENLERSNTTPNPIPSDTTLDGRTNRQTQEAIQEQEEEMDVRTSPGTDHTDKDATRNKQK